MNSNRMEKSGRALCDKDKWCFVKLVCVRMRERVSTVGCDTKCI